MVRILLDRSEAGKKYSQVLKLHSIPGIDLRVRGGYQLSSAMHTKILIIGDVVFMGSLNLSNNGLTRNHEVIVDDGRPATVHKYVGKMDLWYTGNGVHKVEGRLL